MTASTFNPLAAARALEAAGVERGQAEAHAEALRQAATADRDEFATKADLDNLRSQLHADLAGLEGRMYRALWLQGAGIVAVLAALRFLPM